MKPRFSYDPKCEDLASDFLREYPHDTDHVQKLAQTIQDAIENWMLEFERAPSESSANHEMVERRTRLSIVGGNRNRGE